MDDVKKALEVLKNATASCSTGDRHIAVLPNGFIFAGNLSFDEVSKTYTIANCKNVRKWSTGGVGGLCLSATDSGATLDDCAPVKFHASRLIFAVPITEDWDG